MIAIEALEACNNEWLSEEPNQQPRWWVDWREAAIASSLLNFTPSGFELTTMAIAVEN